MTDGTTRRYNYGEASPGFQRWRRRFANCSGWWARKAWGLSCSTRPCSKLQAKKTAVAFDLAQLLAWIDQYNEVLPHRALGYRSPREFIATTCQLFNGGQQQRHINSYCCMVQLNQMPLATAKDLGPNNLHPQQNSIIRNRLVSEKAGSSGV